MIRPKKRSDMPLVNLRAVKLSDARERGRKWKWWPMIGLSEWDLTSQTVLAGGKWIHTNRNGVREMEEVSGRMPDRD